MKRVDELGVGLARIVDDARALDRATDLPAQLNALLSDNVRGSVKPLSLSGGEHRRPTLARIHEAASKSRA